ncbi:MAG: hypothetical protein L0Y78_02405 [candidate division NC10 bacterium]|nr:hypothetical protein [candidate division NC10 bacterium]
MKIMYTKYVPYSPSDVLSAYFDLEHIAHVHPATFGKARVLGTKDNAVVWELESPRYLGIAFRIVINQEYLPPDRIRARVTKGIFRGTEVLTLLQPRGTGTFIEETYAVPLPDWPVLGSLARTWLCRKVDEIWDEDLAVGLPRGGWPGFPAESSPT